MKKQICIGCLRDLKTVKKEGCGSQNCPGFEYFTDEEIQKMKDERDVVKNVINNLHLRYKRDYNNIASYSKQVESKPTIEAISEIISSCMSILKIQPNSEDKIALLNLAIIIQNWAILCNNFNIPADEAIAYDVHLTDIKKRFPK